MLLASGRGLTFGIRRYGRKGFQRREGKRLGVREGEQERKVFWWRKKHVQRPGGEGKGSSGQCGCSGGADGEGQQAGLRQEVGVRDQDNGVRWGSGSRAVARHVPGT